jgi:hypothetical protein
MAPDERYQKNATARSPNRVGTDNLLHRPVSSLYEQMQCRNRLSRGVFIEYHDQIYRAQCA